MNVNKNEFLKLLSECIKDGSIIFTVNNGVDLLNVVIKDENNDVILVKNFEQ
ncbi:MAG: hypothetical protein LLF98_01805 [Clostridium sp.]|uniref:hypothetical protein n=1 Tax=Clostridium sp. TaxID=1506 RepID=UPI0025C26CC3|nr:hypothetical protein [Clostridium sp.]MCE5220015.1 hypothetical protein [Clostridium sp.]